MPLNFTISGDYPIGDDPVALAVADLNGDGTPDIVTVNKHDGTISILQGNGDGTFAGAAVLPVGSFPTSIAVADLNGDGAADLAIADKDDGMVSVLLGRGDGTFLSQANFATASLPLSVTIGDLNGDGKLDLVTGSSTAEDASVSVLLGNGDGTFQPQVAYSVPGASNAVALADLNGDGKSDLVAMSPSFASVLLGNGDGTFQTPDVVGFGGYSVAIADLNGDGIFDLVKTQGGSVLVQLGDGDGTFQPQTSYADGPGAFRVAVADLDGDGRPDLAVSGDTSVQVLLGNGDGTFQPAQSFSVDLPHAVAIADLNNDGKLDIATVNATDTVSILFNTPNVPPTIRLFEDTGASASDHITANPMLTGTATPGTAVTLTEGTTVLGTRMADGTGTWGFLFPTLPTEGSHTVTVNTAGGSSSLTFTLDNSLVTPTIGLAHDTGTSASDNVTSDATLTGTTDAGAAVAVYDLTGVITSGGSSPPVLLATVTADAGGTWSYTPSLPDGRHVFMAHATDLAGNVRDSAPLYMTLDTTAPTIRLFDDTGASASDHITVNPMLTGTAAPMTAVTLMEGTTVLGTGTVDGTGKWAFLPTIEQGSHTVTVNTAGGSSSLTFTLDNSLVTPTIGLAHDTGTSASDNVTSDATLTGTTDAGAAVAVYDLTGVITSGGSSPPVLLATVTADAGGTWSYTPSLPDGRHVFMAHATDLAGNVRDSAPLYMTLDTTAPTIRLFDDTGASASDHITVNPMLTGTAAPMTAVTLMEGTTVLGTGTVDGTGKWAFLPTIEQGSHTVTVNTAGGSSSLTFTLDNSLVTPTIGLAHDTGTSASDNVTSDATLTGTTDAGAAVAVYDLTGVITSGGSSPPVLLATVTADAGGTWSYTPSLPDGRHVFMAHATDLAGNVRDSAPLYMTLDTTAPTIRLFDDTGASASDHITVNPMLTGTAAPMTAVTLMEGTTVLGTGTVDGTGKWAFLPTIEQGSHTVTVNTAGGSSSLTFTLDNSLVTPTIGLAHDTGTSASDNVTSDATLTGTTDAGAAVAVYDLTGVITSGGSSPPVLLATVTADAGGTWSYTPSLPDGPHAFMAHATDLAGNMRDSSLLYMTLDTTAPVAADDSYSTAEDTPLVIAAAGVMTNDTDAGTNRLSASLVAGPAHGTLAFNADGGFTYAPALNYNGADSFTYKVNDETADSNIATVALTVTAVNDRPVANSDSYTVHQGTPLVVGASGVLANDSDPDGDPLTAIFVPPSKISGPDHGQVTLNSDGSFTYTPQAGYLGPDSFDYRASDGAASTEAHVSLMVTDQAPVASSDSYTVRQGTPLVVGASGVLANDSDPDGDPLTAIFVPPSKISGPDHGQVTLNSDGSFTYTPQAGYLGPDSFDYRASDGAASTEAHVSLMVTDQAPVASSDSYTVHQGTPLVVGASGVLANDSDPDGDPLTAILVPPSKVHGPNYGQVALNSDGSFTYTPQAGYVGPDSFDYKASDGAATSTTHVNLMVTDQAPVANSDSYTVHQGTALIVGGAGVLANDTDPDGDQLTAILVPPSKITPPDHGQVTLNSDGSFTYTPNAGYVGPDSFYYKASDGAANSSITHVDLMVTNQAPVAANDINGVTVGQIVRADAAHGVLANDVDPDGDGLHVSAVNGVAANVGSAVGGEYGSLILRADGSYSYSAGRSIDSQVVQDTFTYTANDGSASSTGTLTVTVIPRGFQYMAGTPDHPLNGTATNEVLDASLGHQVVNAGAGNDILIAGAGDTLTGGLGHDTFDFHNFGSASATITDFQPLTDHLQFDPGVTVTSVTTGASGLDLHLSNGGDVIFQTAFPLPDWHLLL